MNHFQRQDGVLHAEAIPLARARRGATARRSTSTRPRRSPGTGRCSTRSLPGSRHLICYAVKANSNLAILALFAQLGSGFDIVSGGELFRVLKAGGDPRKVVFSGVGKRDDELAFALDVGVGTINVESAGELRAALGGGAAAQGPRAHRAPREPGRRSQDPPLHLHRPEGEQVRHRRRRGAAALPAGREGPRPRSTGVACHIGSQITTVKPFVDAVARVLALVADLQRQGIASTTSTSAAGWASPTRREPPRPRRVRPGAQGGAQGLQGRAAGRAGSAARGERRRAADPRPLREAERQEDLRASSTRR